MRSSGPAFPSREAALGAMLDEDDLGLEPSGSLVMAPKLAQFRTSLAEPYFSRKSKPKATPSADSAELAQLRSRSRQMGRDFQALLSAHERQEAAVLDLRRKVRDLRQELEGREKGLELARRTVERLTAEKGALESAAAGSQAYIRKLETRLLSVRNAAELQHRCNQLKGELDSLAHALHAAEARAEAAEQAGKAAALDAACLKRGLELAAEQLTRSAGAEVPGTLLRAVARGQEEALELSGQLADARQQVAQLSAALEQARAHLQAQQTALAQQQGERQELRQQAEVAEAGLEKQRAATAELRRVLDALRPKAGALAEERESLLHQLELERTAAADAQKEVKQLKAALRQKSATEAALRDELRRSLAGEGTTPSPAARQGRPGTGLARPPSGAGERSEMARITTQQGAAAHKRRAGTAAMASAGGAGARQQRSPAGPSPSRALARLQEQRREQQGSRLGVWAEKLVSQGELQPQAGVHHTQRPGGWEAEANEAWQADPAEQQQRRQQKRHPSQFSAKEDLPPLELLPAPAAAQSLPVQDGRLMQVHAYALDEQIALLESDLAQLHGAPSPIATLKQRHSLTLPAAAMAAPPAFAEAGGVGLPDVGKTGARPVGSAAKAEQEGRAGVRSIGAWRPNGIFQQAAEPPAQQAAAQGVHGMQQLMSPGADTPAPAMLWHSNPLAGTSPTQPQASALARPAPAAQLDGGDGALTVRALPPPRFAPGRSQGLQQQQPAPQGQRPGSHLAGSAAFQPAEGAGGAAWMGSSDPAAVAGPSTVHSAAPQQTEDWLWAQLQQALTPQAVQPPPPRLQLAGDAPGSCASSPSLRLPAALGLPDQQQQQQPSPRQGSQRGSASSPARSVASRSQQGQQQREAAPRAQQAAQHAAQPGVSGDSCGRDGAASLSHHWELPSSGPDTLDWLSHEHIEDIEHLEVNSSQTPQRTRQVAAGGSAGSPAQAGSGDSGAKRAASSTSSGSSGWLAEYGRAGARYAEPQRAPLLPGLPLVASSPVAGQRWQAPGPADTSAPGTPDFAALEDMPLLEGQQAQHAQHVPQQAQQAQQRTLFDLADMDLHELLA